MVDEVFEVYVRSKVIGNLLNIKKCDGCGKTTPFFGEMYGRMSKEWHGSKGSGMAHSALIRSDDEVPNKEFEEFNQFKNRLLIPFYGTVLSIRTLVAGLRRDLDQWEKLGLSGRLALNLTKNKELKHWFTLRVVVALVPVVGTLINGALDAIAQLGIAYRMRAAPVTRNVTVL